MAGGARQEIGEEELKQRVALLRRFRELLQDQRKRFGEYLEVLDRQKDVIESGDTDALVHHVELEEKLVADIFAIQKVVEPLEGMYRDINRAHSSAKAGTLPGQAGTGRPEAENHEAEIPQLKSTLEDLKAEVVRRSERNRALLGDHLEKLRQEIRALRNNPWAAKKSVYADSQAPSLIDIKG